MEIKIRDIRKKGFCIIDNEAILIMAKEIGTIALGVYLSLVCHADNETQESFPSQQTIADELGIKKRETISKNIKILEEHNMIKVEKTRDTNTGQWLHNTYLLLDKSTWKSTPHETGHGDRVPFDGVRSEAKPMSRETDTNYTHVLTKPIGEEPIVNNEKVNEDFEEWQESKKKRKANKGKRFGNSTTFGGGTSSSPYEKKPLRKGVDLTDLR